MRSIKGILQLSLLLASGWWAWAAPLPSDFKVVNAETVFYPEGSVRAIARCKVAAVFVDHRKLGFFQVRLLPILVMQGVSIELGEAYADDAWMQELGANFLPELKTQAVEWREVDLISSRTNSPHLHAQLARLADGKDPVICRLENCSIEWRGQRWHTARATWQTAAARPQLVWRTDAGIFMHWDLSTGEIATND
jgi:hypothetical protein